MKGQILICVGGITVHRGADGAIFFSVQEDVKVVPLHFLLFSFICLFLYNSSLVVNYYIVLGCDLLLFLFYHHHHPFRCVLFRLC